MSNGRVMNRVALVGGAAAIVVMGAFTAGCSSSTTEEPTTTTTPSSSVAVVSPTEKAITPGGDSSFSPTIVPTQQGGTCSRIVNGVCMR